MKLIVIEAVCVVFIVLLWVLLLVKCIVEKKRIDSKLEEERRKRKEIENELYKLNKKINEISARLCGEQKVESVQGNNTPLAQKKENTPPAQVGDSLMSTEQLPHEDTEAQYLYHHGDGILRVVPSKDQAYYQVTFSIGQNEGKFDFIGDARKAFKNRSAILDDVCEANNFILNVTQIHTDKWGICVRQQDGTWKVTKKAVISYK